MEKKKSKKGLRVLFIICALIMIPVVIFLVYTGFYYHATPKALAALESDDSVSVIQVDKDYLFDGPGEEDLMIFYPGAKVEVESYAPFLKKIAERGMDVYIVDMPFHLAFLGINFADDVISNYSYENYYMAGHSLGGAACSIYTASHSDIIDGLALCASFSTKKIDESVKTLIIYGSEDDVLNKDTFNKNLPNIPRGSEKYILHGGNHAYFGDYGFQRGDGIATITEEEQQDLAADKIIEFFLED
jgi:hypothetical protein